MKALVISTLLINSLLSFAQTTKYEISLIQYGKEVTIKKNEATLDKAPFQLVYKFSEAQSWGLIAGSNKRMTQAYPNGTEAMGQLIQNARSGGADSYFNPDKSIRAWDGEIESNISYEDDQRHSFDSIYKRGKSIFGVRTISKLSTKEDELLIEEWPDPILIIATAQTVYNSNIKEVSNTIGLRLNLKEIPNSSVMDVKGKSFLEDGVAEFQEGCEGCGNLGSFDFLKNGKEVEFLFSGSDIFEYGPYIQEGNQVIIAGGVKVFTVSADGTQLTDNEYGTKYNLVLRKKE